MSALTEACTVQSSKARPGKRSVAVSKLKCMELTVRCNRRNYVLSALLLCVIGSFSFAHAQSIPRSDAIWARTVPPGTITLDGKLDEPAWALADSVHIYYGRSSGRPGSGWMNNAQNEPTDPIHTTVKFLVCGDSLYVGAWVPDSSIGGGPWPRFDGFLINIYDITTGTAEPHEYFFGWETDSWGNPGTGAVGAMPTKIGGSASDTTWQAAAYVLGTPNSDTTANGTFSPDTGYYLEMRFFLGARGYHIDNPNGGVILFSMAQYDADWEWPLQAGKFSAVKAWIQGPWSNTERYDALRIYTNPGVTLNSGTEPAIPASYIIPNAEKFSPPTIDGNLDDPVWKNIKGFRISYGDTALRASYPGAGKYLSGQIENTIDGTTQNVGDPNTATIKACFIGDTLYLAADVDDKVVTSYPNPNQWDGIGFTINDDTALGSDHQMKVWDLVVRVGLWYLGTAGNAILNGDGPYMSDSLHAVQAALMLKPGTNVNDVNNAGTGYQVEVAVDLTKLGYPDGLGNHNLWLGVDMYDYDAYSDTSRNTSTETWWYRRTSVPEVTGSVGPAWCYMDPNTLVTSVRSNQQSVSPTKFALVGNYPNPFNPSTIIMYTLPEAARVTLTVFNVLGQKVQTADLGMQSPGKRQVTFNASRLSSGVYFYQLQMKSANGKIRLTATGKMLLLK